MVYAKTSIIVSFIWSVTCLSPATLFGQELPVNELNEVEIRGNRMSEYAVGAKTTITDSAIIVTNQPASLADLLNDYTSAHIKSHGNGMLSSISFRGTGPEHTAVLWHGVNIGYPMLGQSDFSLIPLALNDQLQIQHGTGSSLYGTGALGGTIAVGSTQPAKGLKFGISQWAGSFATFNTHANASYANNRYFIKLLATRDQSENNFTFTNTTKLGMPTETQENAAYERLGFGLESGVKLGAKGQLLISGQFLDMDRQVQPSMNVSDADDFQLDKNLRLRTRYAVNGSATNWYVQYAYIDDEINYNGGITQSNQHVWRSEIDHRFTSGLKGSLAVDHSLVGVSAEFYQGHDVSETRTNIWMSLLAYPKPWLMLSANLRQAFHPVYKAPLSPSLGAEFVLRESNYSTHRISLMAARGFRIPTLNELYWEPGGNLDLIPEDSYSAELGYHGESGEQVKFNYDITGYRMWVTNWILWRPNGSFWSPENLREVDVYGLETSAEITHGLGLARISWQGNYAYTKSINRTATDQFDRSVDKQLTYTPIHKGGLTVTSSLKTWTFLVNNVVIGERFITADNENSLPAYTLVNLRLAKEVRMNRYNLNIHASVNNLLNTSYQSVANRAMPGINYQIGINLNFINPEL